MSATTDYSQFVWELEPFKGAGSLRLNEHIDHVKEILGKETDVSFNKKTKIAESYSFSTDGTDESHISCDVTPEGMVTRLLFWNKLDVTYKGRHLFKEPQGRITFWLAAEAKDNKEFTEALGCYFPELGIDINFGSPFAETEAQIIESEQLSFVYEQPLNWVAIFLRGYLGYR